MSVSFNGTTQYLLNSSPGVSIIPLTAAMWVRPKSTSAGGHSIFSRNIGAVDCHSVYRDTAQWGHYHGGTATLFGTVVANRWAFVVWRMIANNNSRVAVLDETGPIYHSQATDNVTSGTATTLSIGACYFSSAILNPIDADIEHFSLWDADIQMDGAQLDNSLLYQLAFRGPFSLPHLKKDLAEYRSLQTGVESGAREVYTRRDQVWTMVGSPTTGLSAPVLGGRRGPPGSMSAIAIPM